MSETPTEDEARTLIVRWMPTYEATLVLAYLDARPKPVIQHADNLVRDAWGNPLCGACGWSGFFSHLGDVVVMGHLDRQIPHTFLPVPA